jgi:hypothetical protein
LNKGILSKVERVIKKKENVLLKQTQELNNFVKENFTIN